MSGGSFNYLYCATLLDRQGDLEAMAQTLAAFPGGQRAAAMTQAIVDDTQRAERALSDVWHAVEWWQSCDYGPEQVAEELSAFNAAHGEGVVWHRFPCGCSMQLGADGQPTGRRELGCEGHRMLARLAAAAAPEREAATLEGTRAASRQLAEGVRDLDELRKLGRDLRAAGRIVYAEEVEAVVREREAAATTPEGEATP